MSKRIAIFVIAYDAVETLGKTIDRIPAEVMEKAEEIFVIDDCSQDNTYYAALGYKQARGIAKLRVFRNPVNLRYGGNQKAGYRYALERGFDIVVMLHADGQYAPELLPTLLAPLERDEADMVFGSRMAAGGAPLKGGMPLYKFWGNKVLTWIENKLTGLELSEFHSGYRLYSCHALARVPFIENSDEWHFDTQILLQFKQAGLRIAELPIPTYYGDEICHVNGIPYALNCIVSALQFNFHRRNWLDMPEYRVEPVPTYVLKTDAHSSHSLILDLLRYESGAMLLEVGTASGYLTERLKSQGARITGIEVDAEQAELARPHCEEMLVGDVESLDLGGLGPFDVLLCADVLEHLRDPETALSRLVTLVKPGGLVLVCVPNIALWVWRLKLLFGRFDYQPQGPMDRTHLRFFTRETLVRMLQRLGLGVERVACTPIPLPQVFPSFGPGRRLSWLHAWQACLTSWMPTLLAYQFVVVARTSSRLAAPPMVTLESQLN